MTVTVSSLVLCCGLFADLFVEAAEHVSAGPEQELTVWRLVTVTVASLGPGSGLSVGRKGVCEGESRTWQGRSNTCEESE